MSITSPRPAAIPAAGRRFRVRPRDAGHASHSWVGHTMGTERRLQLALGLIWLADGVLQLQSFMFTRSFVTQIITPNTIGQPRFIAWPITLTEHLIEPRVALFNASAATIQILIGLGLLYRPTVRMALLGSFAWALGVWWIGEGLGGLFTGAASPLTGAPGAALLYVFAGLIMWPGNGRPQARRPVRGMLVAWSVLWLGLAALWLLPANRAADAAGASGSCAARSAIRPADCVDGECKPDEEWTGAGVRSRSSEDPAHALADGEVDEREHQGERKGTRRPPIEEHCEPYRC